MRCLVIYNDSYSRETYIYEFDTRLEADKFLSDRVTSENMEYYELIEFTQKFDVATAVDAYRERLMTLREAALAKLTDEDKIILGVK